MTGNTAEKAELLNVLIATSCPLLVRSDEWWIDELLFKPGKPRTELLLWVISKATNMFFGSTDLESTSVSSASNSFKLPETDEGILDVFVNAGICSEKELAFVQGNMPPAKQLAIWELLLKPLAHLDKNNISTSITFGCSALHSTVNMDNFLDTFTMKASLLPADVQHEIKHIANSPVQPESHLLENPFARTLLYDESFVQSFKEQVEKLKELNEQYLSVYNNDWKISIPKNQSSPRLVEIGAHINTISERVAAWNEKVDCIMELGKRNNLESSRQKTESSLKNALINQSFEPFRNLCDNIKSKD